MAEATEQTPPVDVDETPALQSPALQNTKLTELAAEANTDTAPGTPEEDAKSKRVTLADLSAKGNTFYAHRNYDDAAEIFSLASNLQAELNGELAPENAEILFHYGRSLFRVGQSKSDVLGGPAAAENKAKPKASASSSKPKPAKTDAEKSADGAEKKEEGTDANKPLFQFTGDENFDESDDDEEDGAEEQEEEDDDLATSFEILDLARVCYLKQLEQSEQPEEGDKGKEVAEDSSAVKHIKERLAETHDCLAEISLENERYPNAIEDGRISLNYKIELYPEESEIIAEAHYKLSLALEFASVTTSGEDGANTKREEMDQGLRDESVKEMELAIKSFRLKMQGKEVELATSNSPEDNEFLRKGIVEMKEVIADMEQRLVDLKKDPVDANDLLGGADGNPLGGIFGAALGESAAETQARIEEAQKTATDLTGLVRKKKAKTEDDESAPAANGKRKAEDVGDGSESPKKAKVDDE